MTTINERISSIVDAFFNGNVSLMSRSADLKQSTLRDIVGDKKCSPSFETLQKIVEISTVKINPEWLITGNGNMIIDETYINDSIAVQKIVNHIQQNEAKVYASDLTSSIMEYIRNKTALTISETTLWNKIFNSNFGLLNIVSKSVENTDSEKNIDYEEKYLELEKENAQLDVEIKSLQSQLIDKQKKVIDLLEKIHEKGESTETVGTRQATTTKSRIG